MNSSTSNAPQGRRGPRQNADYVRFAGAGLQFALTFLALGALGWWLDGRLGTEPWLMILGILLGAAGAFYSLVKRLGPVESKRAGQAEDRDTHSPR